MTLFLLVYFAGVLTIVSPCILPVLPFVFTRADQSFLRSGLPMLIGMAASFAVVATLTTVVGNWAISANQYGRIVALVLLALLGASLLFPQLAQRLMQPLVALGTRMLPQHQGQQSIWPSLLTGIATGLLWAPCAGPVLGLILTGAALQGASAKTSLLLLTYALGAISALAVALLVGGKVFVAMKRSLGLGEWVKRCLGVLVLLAVVAIGMGLDTGLLTQLSLASTNQWEQRLLDRFHPTPPLSNAPSNAMMMSANNAMMSANPNAMMSNSAMAMSSQHTTSSNALESFGTLPSLAGATAWLNSKPLDATHLKGKVILIDFWTYSCINCLRALPYVRAWAEKYKNQGLVVIGVHTPEFAFEKILTNVKKAVSDLHITYPVAVDNNYTIWRAFNNQYWPAHYFVDAKGQIRHRHFGEGQYDASEKVIQQLLAEAGASNIAADTVKVAGTGVAQAADDANVQSPETYLGYARTQNFVSPGGAVENQAHNYAFGDPRLNEWGLQGNWTMSNENIVLNTKDGSITYRFHARDLHLVLGPAQDGKPIRFRITIDGKAPGTNAGVDVNHEGVGKVTDQRLYQLVRQKDAAIADHTFEIKFFDPGVQAYAFTFG